MSSGVSIIDFKTIQATYELRYDDAYLIYDRTGRIAQALRRSFTNLRAISAAPVQTLFQADEGGIALELGQCRFSRVRPERNLEEFSQYCKRYFDAVFDFLEINMFTRIGLRVIFRKEFSNVEDAKALLTSLKLTTLEKTRRFGAAEHPEEILLRWQSEQIGAMVRLRATTGIVNFVLPPELEEQKAEIHKVVHALLVDVDYYTVAPVERAQWDACAWIPPAARTIHVGLDSILAG